MSSGGPWRTLFQAEDAAELLRFVREHRVTDADEARASMLLARLPRTPGHVLDLADGGGRALVASVLDTLSNASDSAVLAVLAHRGGPDAGRVVERALELAEALVHRGPRRRLDVPLPRGLRQHAPQLAARGYAVAFLQLRMARPADTEPLAPPPDPALRWLDLEEEHVDAYRAVAAAALTGLPGSHVPDPAALRAALLEAPIRPRLLFCEGRLAGLVRLGFTGDIGVVQLLARDPALRGLGLGDRLLLEARRALHARGARHVELEVNAENPAAIALYQRHGFEVEDEEPTYRLELDG